MTTFIEHLGHYIAERRHYGGDCTGAEWNLRPFAAFADAEGAEWITVELFLLWKDRFGAAGTATWRHRLNAVRGFTAWLKLRDPRTEVPSEGLVPKRYQRPAPYIYTDDEIVQIVTEAAKLPSPRGLLGKTLATLFGLLAASGLRIGEALGLDDLDVDLDAAVLHVGNAKNGDSRFIPITDCTAGQLRVYRGERNRALGTAPTAFFTSESGKRLAKVTAERRFATLSLAIGLREKPAGGGIGRGPRLHDMRHTFATKTIIDWFRAGRDPDREMYKLSTYLGHTDPDGTYWYIEAVPELLQLVSERAERCFREGEES
ncbi:MAG: tyrosine-type recombinase/integrase [Rhodospirillaceae bacterium]|nr:tyrosine-type recombinase/integrase [Rhodospirillaceae bacterium]